MLFSPKYRGKVLEGEVAEAAEEIIWETCKELDIEIIDMAMNVDHVHLFIKYPQKYSVSWIAKWINGRSSKLLRDKFPQLREWCPGHLEAPSCYHKTFKKSFIKNASQSVGQGWGVEGKYISGQKDYEKAEAIRGRGEKGAGSFTVMGKEMLCR
jgi:putative transposase